MPGWVIEPVVKTEKAPAVLVIHGGPKGMYKPAFSFDLQVLASKGYYVIFTNPPGSDGYGNDYSNIRGVFGSLPYKELMTYLDEVLDQYPQIDKSRIGLMGGSYGGYLTNYIITRTDRFKAAISARGISSMINSFMSSDIGFEYVYEYMDGKTPWSHRKDFLEASPLYDCELIKTPTLFLHGEKDKRCHVTESLNMYHALTYLGIETGIRIFEDEGHGFVRSGQPRHRLERYQLMITWFRKHLQEGI
nr:prolyl oligopeptidase family serine peptidase [Acidaminobacter sp. JC074]